MTTCTRFDAEVIETFERGERPADSHFDECADCHAAKASYAAMRRGLAELPPVGAPSPDWEAKVWAKIARAEERPRVWRWVPALATAMAAVVVFVALPRSPSEPSLQLDVRPREGEVVRSVSAKPGDLLAVKGSAGKHAHAQLRVYRDGALVFSCSGEPACKRDGELVSAEMRLEAVGRYETILLLDEEPIAKPSAGSQLNVDLDAATEQGTKIVSTGAVDVF